MPEHRKCIGEAVCQRLLCTCLMLCSGLCLCSTLLPLLLQSRVAVHGRSHGAKDETAHVRTGRAERRRCTSHAVLCVCTRHAASSADDARGRGHTHTRSARGACGRSRGGRAHHRVRDQHATDGRPGGLLPPHDSRRVRLPMHVADVPRPGASATRALCSERHCSAPPFTCHCKHSRLGAAARCATSLSSIHSLLRAARCKHQSFTQLHSRFGGYSARGCRCCRGHCYSHSCAALLATQSVDFGRTARRLCNNAVLERHHPHLWL